MFSPPYIGSWSKTSCVMSQNIKFIDIYVFKSSSWKYLISVFVKIKRKTVFEVEVSKFFRFFGCHDNRWYVQSLISSKTLSEKSKFLLSSLIQNTIYRTWLSAVFFVIHPHYKEVSCDIFVLISMRCNTMMFVSLEEESTVTLELNTACKCIAWRNMAVSSQMSNSVISVASVIDKLFPSLENAFVSLCNLSKHFLFLL